MLCCAPLLVEGTVASIASTRVKKSVKSSDSHVKTPLTEFETRDPVPTYTGWPVNGCAARAVSFLLADAACDGLQVIILSKTFRLICMKRG